jgi:PhzF family phenazine biosynthesis protein
MNVLKLVAFSHNDKGGNPASVVFYDAMPSNEEMLKIAKEVGYSETAFLVKQGMIGESVAVSGETRHNSDD